MFWPKSSSNLQFHFNIEKNLKLQRTYGTTQVWTLLLAPLMRFPQHHRKHCQKYKQQLLDNEAQHHQCYREDFSTAWQDSWGSRHFWLSSSAIWFSTTIKSHCICIGIGFHRSNCSCNQEKTYWRRKLQLCNKLIFIQSSEGNKNLNIFHFWDFRKSIS